MKRHLGAFYRMRRLTAALMALALLVTGTPTLARFWAVEVDAANKEVSDLQDEFDEMEKELDALKKQLKKLQSQESDYLDQVANFNEQINLVEDQITAVNQEIELLNQDIQGKNDEILLLDGEIAELSQSIEENRELFMERLKAFHLNGEASELEILLGSESFSDFLNRYAIIQAVADRDKSLMDGLEKEMKEQEARLAEYEERKAELEQKVVEAETLQAQLLAKEDELEGMKDESQKLLDKVKNDEKAKQNAIAALDADMEALEKEIEEAIRNSTGSFSGKFYWPCPGYSRISSNFGYRYHPVTGQYKLHKGVDIAAAKNTPILAAADGKVTTAWATEHGSYGKYVIIDHGGGYVTLYAHCNSVSVKAGDKVKKGDTIAKVGKTGTATGYHLHFEIRENGNYIDPMEYFPGY